MFWQLPQELMAPNDHKHCKTFYVVKPECHKSRIGVQRRAGLSATPPAVALLCLQTYLTTRDPKSRASKRALVMQSRSTRVVFGPCWRVVLSVSDPSPKKLVSAASFRRSSLS